MSAATLKSAQTQPQFLFAISQAAFDLALLVGLFFLVVGGFVDGAGFAFFGEGEEAGEVRAADLRPVLPELGLEVGELAVEAGDGFDVYGHAGTEYGEAVEVG